MLTDQQVFTYETKPKCFQNITKDVSEFSHQAGLDTALCHLFVPHTSCSLIITENMDLDVLGDLQSFMTDLVPETRCYAHGTEGPDDMPAHIRNVLTSPSQTIPLVKGELALGQWQGIFLWEHRNYAHERKVIVTLSGL